jgi:hypothetical protein
MEGESELIPPRPSWPSEACATLRLTALSAVLAMVLVTGSVACGGRPESSNALVISAAARTAKLSSFQVVGTGRAFETAHPSRVVLETTSTWVVDAARRRSQLSITGYTAYPRAKRSSVTFGVIEIGDDGWILDPTAATPGRPWVKETSRHRPQLTGPFKFDPTRALTDLHATGFSSTALGHDTIDGVVTSRYRITKPPAPRPKTSPSIRVKDFEIWIDLEGLVRRVRLVESVGADPNESPKLPATTETMTTKYEAFGDPTSISPPPPDQVTTLAHG